MLNTKSTFKNVQKNRQKYLCDSNSKINDMIEIGKETMVLLTLWFIHLISYEIEFVCKDSIIWIHEYLDPNSIHDVDHHFVYYW